jgi:uncharacterized protein DUF4154
MSRGRDEDCAERADRRRAGRRACFALLCAVISSQPLATAQDAPARVSERSVKAAFLYKFASYVQWPGETRLDAPLTIGILGANDFARELTEITADRTVANRPIRIRRIGANDSYDGLDILFIGREEESRLAEFLAAAGMRPILTVTETAGAIADGSIINFTVDEDRVRFEVSLDAAERSQLKLNARLLAVAQQVHRGVE